MKNRTYNPIKRLCALLLGMLLAISTLAVCALADDSAAINEDKNGVLQIVWCIPDTIGGSQGYFALSSGSGFLVNDQTLITSNHVLHFTGSEADAEVAFMVENFGNNWQKKTELRVYYTQSNYFLAKEISAIRNEVADYTAVKLEQPISGHKILPLGSTENLNPTDSCYALGLPLSKSYYTEDVNKDSLTSKDVNIETGSISKLTEVDHTAMVNHSATTIPGMSGGPLVDGNGNVIGVNKAYSLISDNNYYAVDISQVKNALITTGTEFIDATDVGSSINNGAASSPAESSAQQQEAPPVEPTNFDALKGAISAKEGELSDSSKKYTDESVKNVNDALESARGVANNTAATQAEVDAALQALNAVKLEEKQGPAIPMGAIIGIAVAVVAVVIVIIVLVARGKGKGDDEDDYPNYPPQQPVPPTSAGGFNQSAPNPAPVYTPPTAAPASPPTDVLGGSSNETTVLSGGSNETTVLSSRPYGKLTRSSSGESVDVAAEHFLIGKERSKVSYCISNNGAISRTHAEITKTGGGISLIDKNSKNGTFLNGVKCESGRAVPLKDGDRITLADEEFIFHML